MAETWPTQNTDNGDVTSRKDIPGDWSIGRLGLKNSTNPPSPPEGDVREYAPIGPHQNS